MTARAALLVVVALDLLGCRKEDAPVPVEPTRAGDTDPHGTDAPHSTAMPEFEGRLLMADKVCAALPSGVHCSGTMRRPDSLKSSVRVATHGDVIGLVEHEDLLCGRRRAGPALCWRSKAGQIEEWQLDQPKAANSVAIALEGRVCATSATGELWCGAFGEATALVAAPEPLDVLRGWDAYELCARSLDGDHHCRSAHNAWVPSPSRAADYSPTLECLLVAPPDNYVCAWRDEADEQAIEQAGRRATRRIDDAIEIDGTDVVCALRLSGELDCATTVGRADVDPLDALFSKGPMPDTPPGAIEVEGDLSRTCVLTRDHAVLCRGEVGGIGVFLDRWTELTLPEHGLPP